MALIAASVPEFTMRTFSMAGISEQIFFARTVSIGVGAPKLRPIAITSLTRAMTCG